MADDLPREGTFSGVSTGHGTYKAIAIGKERLLLTFNDYAASVSDGFGDHITWNCFGLGDYTKGIGRNHAYCVGADPSGDQLD